MSDIHNVIILENESQVADYLVELWVEFAKDAILEKGRFTAALSGGRTPVEFYQKLSTVDDAELWEKSEIFLTDERFVPFDHKDSSSRMIKENLIEGSCINSGQYHPVSTKFDIADQAAVNYENHLKEFFQLKENELPCFDFVLLGLGENDGHIASLFSKEDVQAQEGKLVISAYPTHVNHDRVSLTLPVLNNATRALFLVTGEYKAKTLHEVLDENRDVPASKVLDKDGSLIYLVDKDAASLLS